MGLQVGKVFDRYAKEYDQWFENHPDIFSLELTTLKKVMPMMGESLEVGVGSGRFASKLGVTFGLDPSIELLKIAKSRGIEIIEGVAESLPFSDNRFDTILFITTLCFVDDPFKALTEAKRVLKQRGILIIAMIDRDSKLGQRYENLKGQNPYYKYAHFFSITEIKELLRKIGFKQVEFYQTDFTSIEMFNAEETAKPGFGENGFIVIKANEK